MICQTVNGPRHIELDQIVCWGSWRESIHGSQIVLNDGSVLLGDPTSLQAEEIAVATEPFGESQIKIRRELVAGVVFRPSTEVLDRDRALREFIVERRTSDSLWLFNGDKIAGNVVSAGDAAGSGIASLIIGESKTGVAIENVVAIACRKTSSVNPGDRLPALWLGLRDGTRLAVSQLVATAPRVELRLACGSTVSAAAEEFWKQVTWLQPAPTKFTYLSDQPNAGFKHIPLLNSNWDLALDQNVLGGALRSAGRRYAKGLGMHSASRSAYNLAGKFRKFEADIAIDEIAGERGSVIFRVFVDRAPAGQPAQWKLDYESPVVRGGSPPIPISVQVAGAERLALVVDFADRGDECDYADWLNARLIP